MAKRDHIVEFLNRKLEIERYSDMCINGLQVEGREDVSSVAVAVDAGETVIARAIELGCEMLVVHHGLFWDKPFPVVGPSRRKLSSLLNCGLNLYAVHLPLDAHAEVGNNFCLARIIGLEQLRPAINYRGTPIGCIGRNTKRLSLGQIEATLGRLPGARIPFVTLEFGKSVPENVCVVTGAGADSLTSFEKEAFDTLITGEPRQFAYHYAEENRLNVICAGHYATETVGVQELGKLLERELGLCWELIDVPTGI
ncbi:MAG: Nif3-like dinuclear metal center hexameric protein [Bdellovibrionota bacterium]